MEINLKPFWIGMAFVAVFCIGYLARWLDDRHRARNADVVTVTDTLTVRDTVVERQPVYVSVKDVDTLLVAVRDTVMLRDTAYIVIDMEQKHYQGEDYEAWVSGFRPQLDSIRVFPETRYITKETKVYQRPKRWGIGVQVGYGLGAPDGHMQAFPYIGVGISYNLIRF